MCLKSRPLKPIRPVFRTDGRCQKGVADRRLAGIEEKSARYVIVRSDIGRRPGVVVHGTTPVMSFLRKADFAGKKVSAFCTHEAGSGNFSRISRSRPKMPLSLKVSTYTSRGKPGKARWIKLSIPGSASCEKIVSSPFFIRGIAQWRDPDFMPGLIQCRNETNRRINPCIKPKLTPLPVRHRRWPPA